jgi:hypothetical protein
MEPKIQKTVGVYERPEKSPWPRNAALALAMVAVIALVVMLWP